MEKLSFASDYQEGAHPAILQRLCETNLLKSAGYGIEVGKADRTGLKSPTAKGTSPVRFTDFAKRKITTL